MTQNIQTQSSLFDWFYNPIENLLLKTGLQKPSSITKEADDEWEFIDSNLVK